jgi:hypothetical protein
MKALYLFVLSHLGAENRMHPRVLADICWRSQKCQLRACFFLKMLYLPRNSHYKSVAEATARSAMTEISAAR